MSADGITSNTNDAGNTNATGNSKDTGALEAGATKAGATGAAADTAGPKPRESTGESAGDGPEREAAKEASRRAEAQATVPEGVLPNKAAEDDPRRWGDQPDNYDHDAWLQEQKPPHWG